MSYGFIETIGIVASLEAADSMIKAANIEIVDKVEIGAGYVTIVIKGDVGAVKAAIDAGVESAKQVGNLVSAHIIPKPSHELIGLFLNNKEMNNEER